MDSKKRKLDVIDNLDSDRDTKIPRTEGTLNVRNMEEYSVSQDDNSGSVGFTTDSGVSTDVSLNRNAETDDKSIALDFDNLDSIEGFFDDDWTGVSEIDLNDFTRCRITNIEKRRKETILSIEEVDKKCIGTVVCSYPWSDAKVDVDDFVYVKAVNKNNEWRIDSTDGFLITDPHIIVSGTTVTGSLFCARKAILQEKFSRINLLPLECGDNMAMIMGKLLHEVFQKAVADKIYKRETIEKIINDKLGTQGMIKTQYASNITAEELKKRTAEYVSSISAFVEHYVRGNKQKGITNLKENYNGNILEVRDIEDTVWVPQLGLKGNIDMVVKIGSNSLNSKIVPLEIKTGKSSMSLEHKGQLILYTMMMRFIGDNPDRGLLLYLKDNIMREVTSNKLEQRDLIISRNNLAYYLARAQKLSRRVLHLGGDNIMELPEPIDNSKICQMCPYSSICCAFLTKDEKIKLPEDHSLSALGKSILRSVTPTHIEYVIKWVTLLHIEELSQCDENSFQDVWLLPPREREKNGTCIGNLNIAEKSLKENDFIKLTFTRTVKFNSNVFLNFQEGRYIMIGTPSRVHITSGFVKHIGDCSVTLYLHKDVSKNYSASEFHIDVYPSASYVSSLGNIGGLLMNEEICNRLRKIVIDRKPATFGKRIPKNVLKENVDTLAELNKCQREAILKALAADDYLLIKGMPGTGKTETIITLIELYRKLNLSVVISSHTHTAVDNILLKLKNRKIDFIRLGAITSVDSLLYEYCEENLCQNCNTPENLEKLYSSKKIVGVTCLGSNHVLLQRMQFDVCIVDESTQVLQSVILRPLYNAKKFILVGDPEQLSPIVKSRSARANGMGESLFTRLDNENNTAVLNTQYRMNEIIMDLANKLTYNDKLSCGSEDVANATFVLPDTEIPSECREWATFAVSPKLTDSVLLFDTGFTFDLKKEYDIANEMTKSERRCSNILEVAIAYHLIENFLLMGVDLKNIGIISPYRSQVKLFKKYFPGDIEMSTVDRFQGRDKDIVIFSCARSCREATDENTDYQILEDFQRLTVAVTRPKKKFILIADRESVVKYTPFKKMYESVKSEYIKKLLDGKNGFSWKEMLILVKK